jgi:hypothetical protein
MICQNLASMTVPPPRPRPFRLAALDLDGTLLNDAGAISPADATALRLFAQSGGLIVLASGRMTANIRPFFDELGLDGPTIAYNGALSREPAGANRGWFAPQSAGDLPREPQSANGKIILEASLPARYADELIEYTRQERFHLNYYLDEVLYARDDPELRRFADLYSRQTGAAFHFVADLGRFRGREPTKLIIVTDPTVPGQPDPRHRDELYEVWQARWGSEVTVMRTNPEYLEFYHRATSKGAALAAVAARYGVARSLTLAFGDGHNDVAMLEWAGCGVAVANAHPDVKASADWVSPLSNSESAVADALERLVARG